ncbi:TRAP transporter small permease [Castellaniella sp. GW247-6E4]|uniref:TRAP transporter small permease n=1 Tax=Castellaniella sp. GW247-6E4 TaxID=3140380 RepID=UPI0033157632
MRKFLDTVYRISGGLAAFSLVGITVIVFGQVLLNLIDYASMALFGESYGLLIPSYSLLSGYALAFATFLSLGLGFRRASHIRVTLVESRLPPRARRATLTVVMLIGVAMGLLFTYSLGELAVQSFMWGDRASGLLRIPLWIPQSMLCLGALMFLIAALDTLVEVLRRGESEALRIESPAEEAL